MAMVPSKVTLPVVHVQVLTRSGPDLISLTLDQDMSSAVHGDKLEIWGAAHVTLQCAHGRHPEALKALGIDTYEVINANTGDREQVLPDAG